MKRTATITVILAILAFFLMAQKAHCFEIAHGVAYKQTLVIVGWTSWGFPELEYVEFPAANVRVNLEWESPRGVWVVVDDVITNEEGEFLLTHPTLEDGVFRISVGSNPPSYVFHWNHPQPPEWIEYYYWFW